MSAPSGSSAAGSECRCCARCLNAGFDDGWHAAWAHLGSRLASVKREAEFDSDSDCNGKNMKQCIGRLGECRGISGKGTTIKDESKSSDEDKKIQDESQEDGGNNVSQRKGQGKGISTCKGKGMTVKDESKASDEDKNIKDNLDEFPSEWLALARDV